VMDTDLRPGSVYLIAEEKAHLSTDHFMKLLGEGRPGLVLSRRCREGFDAPEGSDLCFQWLSSDGAGDCLSPGFEACRSRIAEMPPSACVLLDRLDFMIFRNGFRETLSFIRDLNDLAERKEYTIILSVDPRTIMSRELTMLEKDTRQVCKSEDILLDEELSSVLFFVQKSSGGESVLKFRDIQEGLELSRPTVRKRILSLASLGLITVLKKGRSNLVSLTELGRSYIEMSD